MSIYFKVVYILLLCLKSDWTVLGSIIFSSNLVANVCLYSSYYFRKEILDKVLKNLYENIIKIIINRLLKNKYK